MTFLQAIKPLLGTAAAFQVHLSAKDGNLSLLLLPQLAPADGDEDAGLAAFRAVLARPVKIEVPADADPDTYVVTAITDLAAVRGEAVSELDAYRAALVQAKTDAKAADDARRAESAKKSASGKTAAKPGKASATTSKAPAPALTAPQPNADDADAEGDEEATDTTDAASDAQPASDTAEPAAPPPPAAGQSNLFSTLGL